MMSDQDVAILIVRTAARVIDQTDFRTAEQILIETMATHPHLPWGIVINAMHEQDNRLWWARRALLTNARQNVGDTI